MSDNAIMQVTHGLKRPNTSGANSDNQMVALWLRSKESEQTRIAYTKALEDFYGIIGHKALATITVADLEMFKKALVDEGKAVGTIQLKLNAVKSLLTYASETGYLLFNVGVAVKPPKKRNTLAERILDESEVMKLLNASKVTKTKVMVHLLYYSAIRASELVNLRWKDFQKSGSACQITVTESKSEPRSIVLADKVAHMLLEYKPENAQPNDYIFPGRAPKGCMDIVQMTEQAVYLTVKRLGDKVGIKASPHYFRHSHASHSLRRGADIATVKATLGHANIATTNNYVHARPNESSSLYLPE